MLLKKNGSFIFASKIHLRKAKDFIGFVFFVGHGKSRSFFIHKYMFSVLVFGSILLFTWLIVSQFFFFSVLSQKKDLEVLLKNSQSNFFEYQSTTEQIFDRVYSKELDQKAPDQKQEPSQVEEKLSDLNVHTDAHRVELAETLEQEQLSLKQISHKVHPHELHVSFELHNNKPNTKKTGLMWIIAKIQDDASGSVEIATYPSGLAIQTGTMKRMVPTSGKRFSINRFSLNQAKITLIAARPKLLKLIVGTADDKGHLIWEKILVQTEGMPFS